MKLWLVIAWTLACGVAHAAPHGAVALLPLDADAKLELYGQPVASEIARALVAGDIDVVVVGPKMAVPDRATLIVDGKIAGKGDDVALTVRVRRRIDGTVLDTLTANAPLANIDKAASDLSSRLLPSVRAKLAQLDLPPPEPLHRAPPPPLRATKPAPIPTTAIASTGAGAAVEPLRVALIAATDAWAADQATPLAVTYEVAGYAVAVHDGVPIARARVRVRVGAKDAPQFDRVIHTDSIVGDKGHADALAALAAREVLAILRPHFHRIGGWR